MTTPDAAPVIDEATRAAVLAAECAGKGHIHLFENMLGASQNGGSTDIIAAPDPSQMPHVVCRRCGKVWIVIETTGCCYDDAIGEVAAVMTDSALITPPPRPEPPGVSLPPDPAPVVEPTP